MISSPPEWSDYRKAPINGNWLKRWLKSRFRYVDYPFLLAYRGFGNSHKFFIQGHVFRGMAMTRPKKHNTTWRNFVGLIKMFLVRTVPSANVRLVMGEQSFSLTTNEDGFFEFEVDKHELTVGWHTLYMELVDQLVEGQDGVSLRPEVLIEDDFEYGLISDIDDTFLVSHVTKFWRKLYILITKNAESRKPFKGVVSFYQKLGKGVKSGTNPFFYVSSSEWNLYNFLISFCQFHKLPKGALQLKEIKDDWRDFIQKGSFSDHSHKRVKIERILKLFPTKKFVLLGDNGQHDPSIYHDIVTRYPDQILAVYIRGVKRSNNGIAEAKVEHMREMGIAALQFEQSQEAETHAVARGLIN